MKVKISGVPSSYGTKDVVSTVEHSLISWKSIFAGTFVALMAYLVLTALGTGIGGASLSSAIANNKVSYITAGTIIWTILSVIISLGVGSYFAARTSTFNTARVGAAQGLVIAALFFTSMVYGVSTAVDALGHGIAATLTRAGDDASNIANNPGIKSVVEDFLNEVNTSLKSDPSVVAQGLASRLLEGDTAGARSYLAYQTGLTTDEVNTRLDTLQENFKAKLTDVGRKTSRAVAQAGWSLFAILVAGLLSSLIGGAAGSRMNIKEPLDELNTTENFSTERPAV